MIILKLEFLKYSKIVLILFLVKSRDKMLKELKKNIGCSIHYFNQYHFTFYKDKYKLLKKIENFLRMEKNIFYQSSKIKVNELKIL